MPRARVVLAYQRLKIVTILLCDRNHTTVVGHDKLVPLRPDGSYFPLDPNNSLAHLTREKSLGSGRSTAECGVCIPMAFNSCVPTGHTMHRESNQERDTKETECIVVYGLRCFSATTRTSFILGHVVSWWW